MKKPENEKNDATGQQPSAQNTRPDNPARRRFLAGASVIGLSSGILPLADAKTPSAHQPVALNKLPEKQQDQLLRKHVRNIVVIYAENRSFNNLFANFPGVKHPLSELHPQQYQQRDRDGTLLSEFPPVWKGLVPDEQTVNHTRYQVAENAPYMQHLPNKPFALKGPDGEALPQGVITRDLWHVFYQNQMQINGGKNDKFVAWADSGALTMGHYGDGAYNMRLWNLASEYTLCDNFFQGAFGGSFLNHQYLVCARPPFYPDVHQSPAKDQVATLMSDDPTDPRLKPKDSSPTSALQGIPQFGPSQLTPDGYAVNTMLPPYWPSGSRDKNNPALADLSSPKTLPAQTHQHIGDLLSDKGIDWAWYSGGWQFAVDGKKDSDTFPARPDFQLHHQPLNYFADLGPQHPERRAKHLRDGGLGDTAATNKFLADVDAGKLPPVTFYKPQGNLNMHAGYSDVESGDRHIAHIVNRLQQSPQWDNTVVVITFDENGGWWDHVAPPKGDRWGPGTRIPALVVSPFALKGHVEHTQYDTGSILRLISRVYDLPKLPGLQTRDKALAKQGSAPMGDLTEILRFPV
ncbi:MULTISPECIES: acid phosphatase [unclassified Tatumella]|uniref:acid phosphatase n=1 Tax=unclassified Tatumella TaxID=2649542 RepID=UPI001BAFB645|nr:MULTISPECIES: acid phosphatase [unclassified Tatumella]MBS0856893.1 acid phosphatase [Tatumella sp. JGM16]MBS0913636.1 acid phosphatase [Tatumella sp. JGM91]